MTGDPQKADRLFMLRASAFPGGAYVCISVEIYLIIWEFMIYLFCVTVCHGNSPDALSRTNHG